MTSAGVKPLYFLIFYLNVISLKSAGTFTRLFSKLNLKIEMPILNHKFSDHKINPETETLIIGTFNPETEGNEAEFFYGRSRNFFWRILPASYQEKDLKQACKPDKLAFIERRKIDFIDLILQIEVDNGQERNYMDNYIDSRVIEWRDVISEMEKLKFLKRVCFTRRTFSGIPNMQKRIEAIHAYCEINNILFKTMTTPSRYYSEDKQAEWTKFLQNDN
jgi:G:T/U-mismatch repair DNA glycosylase